MARRTVIAVVLASVISVAAFTPVLWPNQATGSAAGAVQASRVVVIGVPGLQWNDLGPSATPALWNLTRSSAAAALSVRTAAGSRTCPNDAWLTLSAGQRAELSHGSCALPPVPYRSGEGAVAPHFGMIRAENADSEYEAKVGLLGDSVPGCTMAVGPGAVYGGADSSGRVDYYVRSPELVTDWSRCPLAVVEVDDLFRSYVEKGVDPNGDQVPVSRRRRLNAVSRADRRVGQVLQSVPPGTTVLVAGLSDTGGDPHLHVAVAAGPRRGGTGTYAGHYLTSSSTRRDGLVTLTDLTVTVLGEFGVGRPKEATGNSWRLGGVQPDVSDAVRDLEDQDVAAQTYRRLVPSFWPSLAAVLLILYAIAGLILLQRWSGTRARRVLGGMRVVALASAAVPISAFLANLVPWWRFPHPAPVVFASMAGAVLACTGLALAGPWRRSVMASGVVIAGLTAVVLAIDVMTGSRLQMCSFAGYSPVVGGRFYGFSNMAFAVFATATIFTAAWVAGTVRRHSWAWRRLRVNSGTATVLVIGAVAVVVDGWPTWGADFGGVIAIVAGTMVLALQLAGRRLSPRWVAMTCAAAAAIVGVISFADSLRAEPTHLGRFWDDLWSGEGWGVIARKAGAMVGSLKWLPFTLMAVGALAFLFLVLLRPVSGPALERAFSYAPELRPAITASLVIAFTGMLVNDSGVVVAALALLVAVPLALAASVRALELDGRESSSRSAPSATASAPMV